jgi:hypothetical protein
VRSSPLLAALILFASAAAFANPVAADAPGAGAAGPIRFGQLFDAHVSPCSAMTGRVEVIWSDNGNCGGVPGVTSFHYYPAYRADPSRYPGGEDISWFYAHHPDWIEYRVDRVTPAYEFGQTEFTPLDFTNPAIVAWIAATAKAGMVAGQRGIALDNVSAQNSYLMGGHYVGTEAPCPQSRRPACGGTWRRDFIGNFSTRDPAYIAAQKAYIKALRQTLAAAGLLLIVNNNEEKENSASPADEAAVGSMADGVLSEGYPLSGHATGGGGFVNGRMLDTNWDAAYSANVASARGFYFMAPYSGAGMAGITNDEASWIVAMFLLISGSPAENYLSVNSLANAAGDNGHLIPYPPFMNPPVGTPIEAPPAAGCRPCVRRYTNGIVAVNPSSKAAATIILPAGTHRDQFGNSVPSGPYRVPIASGVVITGPPS